MYSLRLIEPIHDTADADTARHQRLGEIKKVLERTEAFLPKTRAHIWRIGAKQPQIATVLARELQQVEKETARLRGIYEQMENPNLGFWLVATGIAVGLSSLVGLWKYATRNKDTAEELENRSSYYDDLIEAGTDPDTAAKLAAGKYSAWPEILTKVGLILAVLVGLYVFVKLKK